MQPSSLESPHPLVTAFNEKFARLEYLREQVTDFITTTRSVGAIDMAEGT